MALSHNYDKVFSDRSAREERRKQIVEEQLAEI
jgi:hypothetical protein